MENNQSCSCTRSVENGGRNAEVFLLRKTSALRPPFSTLLLEKIGIQWQRRPERKWLGELLANERAVGPLLEYLKDTEVGTTKGAAEMTMEWRRKNDQEGDEELGTPNH